MRLNTSMILPERGRKSDKVVRTNWNVAAWSIKGLASVDPVNKAVQLRFTDLQLDRCEGAQPVPDGKVELRWRKEGGKRSSAAVGCGKEGGGNGVNGAPTAGAANTGGGGGGGGGNGTDGGIPVNGAAGGSGIVIIKYALPGPPQGTVLYLR